MWQGCCKDLGTLVLRRWMWHDGGDCNSLQMDLDVLIVPNNKPSFSHISICQKYGFAIVFCIV
jgi:hypothetical protein